MSHAAAAAAAAAMKVKGGYQILLLIIIVLPHSGMSSTYVVPPIASLHDGARQYQVYANNTTAAVCV